MFEKIYKVAGIEGHRQRVAFQPTCHYDFTATRGYPCKVDLFTADTTGAYDYVLVRIACDTEPHCDDEFSGQLSDGIFENSRIGKISAQRGEIFEPWIPEEK